MTKSAAPGPSTSVVEVTNVSPNGLWLLIDERELFVDFKEFPWFADATIRELREVSRPSADHLYWKLLDVDLSVESIEKPHKYPLVSQAPARRVREAPRKTPAKSTRTRRGSA